MTEAEKLEWVLKKINRLTEDLGKTRKNIRDGRVVDAHSEIGRHIQSLGDICVDIKRSITRLNGGTVRHSTAG